MRVTGGGRSAGAPLIVLVGLPGAGKSTVGALLAERLGARFVDLDRWIEERAGRPVSVIFAESGEAEFRRLEREATAALGPERPLVAAPGGGWVMQPGLRRSLAPDALLVWLEVEPAEAARRMGAAAGERPLLAGDAVDRLERLLAEREAAYAAADMRVRTDGRDPEAVVDELLAGLRSDGKS